MTPTPEEVKARRAGLVTTRGTIKAKITRLTNYLKESGKYADENHVDQWILKIDEALEKLPEIETELKALDPNGNHEAETENILFDQEEMLVWVRKFRDRERETNATPTHENRCCSVNSHAVPTNYLSSLPKAQAKTFDGSLEKWRPYRDWFKRFIHSREDLSDAQRFDYLKRTLTGEPEKVINALETTDENYSVAWKLLESTYDVEYVLVFRHCDLLMETPAMKKSSSEELLKLANNIQTQVLAMKALGERVENWNTLLSYFILKRLDKDTEREWHRSKQGNKIPNYEDILKFLREQSTRLISTRSKLSPPGGSQSNTENNKPKKDGSKKGNDGQKTQSLLTTTDSIICPVCKEQHTLDKCDKFLALSVPERIQTARKSHLCLNCFRGNHRTRFCKAPGCSTCQKKHNALVHLTEEQLQASKA